MTAIPFVKMHGLGNDFVVLDARGRALALAPEARARIADRRWGVGCDQLIVIEPAKSGDADAFMRIYNPDGAEAEACGNGTRCVAARLMAETGRGQAVIETVAGLLAASRAGNAEITVDMGPAGLDWTDIPLARETDTLHLPLAAGPLADAVGVNIGNPHAVFFVEDADTIDLETLGPRLEHDPLFPKRANIEAVTVLGPARLRMRVWERGAGITRACGSGACASLVAAVRRGLSQRQADVVLDGGTLHIQWRDDGHVLMTGPVAHSFDGVLAPELLS